MKPEVFKFQRPLFTTDPSQPILIYNESRSIMTQLPLPRKIQKKIFRRGEYKCYWICMPNKETQLLDLIERVEEQDW